MTAYKNVVSICKIDEARQVVKGPVLRPEVRDRQGTIISEDVILEAAHDFMTRLNTAKDGSGPGFMHTEFNRDLTIVESYVLESDTSYAIKDGTQTQIPAGSWMMANKVNDAKIWEGVKNGTFKGFSIGGQAKIQYEGNE